MSFWVEFPVKLATSRLYQKGPPSCHVILSAFFVIPSAFFVIPSAFFVIPSAFFVIPSAFFVILSEAEESQRRWRISPNKHSPQSHLWTPKHFRSSSLR
jgi:hypothetical protein